MLRVFTIFCVLVAVGCLGASEPTSSWRIEAHQVECTGVGTRLCLLRSVDGGEFELFYGSIQGFDFEWGYTYDLRVRSLPVEDPPQDGASQRIELVELVGRERVPPSEHFVLQLSPRAPEDGRSLMEPEGSTGFRFHDVQSFSCSGDSVCNEVRALITSGTPRLALELSHPAEAGAPLVLHRVTKDPES